MRLSIEDRIGANQSGVDAGFYSNNDAHEKPLDQCNRSCTPEQLARIRIQAVKCVFLNFGFREGDVAYLLSGINMIISCDGGCDQPNSLHDITLTWSESELHKDQVSSSSP